MLIQYIQITFIGFGFAIILYLAITRWMEVYRWHKLKRHVREAIEALNLWDVVNMRDITCDVFLSITTFLDVHKYKHCFNEKGGAYWLYEALGEIRRMERERSR